MLEILNVPPVSEATADGLISRDYSGVLDGTLLLVLRNLQAQITALTARVAELENP